MWGSIKRILKKIFKKEVVSEKAPVPIEIDNPSPSDSVLVEIVDNINNGNASDPDWTYLITTCRIDLDKRAQVEAIVSRQSHFWERYKSVSRKTGVPADVIANIHYKESSMDWESCLHNGDRAIGNGKKTWNAPKGRGPFLTWEEAAIDALLMEKSGFPARWTTVEKLKFCQRYNGMGHQRKGLEYSPYIWAYTSHHDETGNYVADGRYSTSAPIKSPGVMAMMIIQSEMKLI